MRKIDMETIMLCAIMAVTGTIGLMAGGAAFAGVTFQECNVTLLAAGGCGLGGILWGVLLILNSHMVSKNV